MKPQVWLMVSNPTPRAYLRALTEDNKRKNLQKSNDKNNFCDSGGRISHYLHKKVGFKFPKI